ncbi:hypothetical protein Hanom_Chr10g00945611 [Helianthus anomalus]
MLAYLAVPVKFLFSLHFYDTTEQKTYDIVIFYFCSFLLKVKTSLVDVHLCIHVLFQETDNYNSCILELDQIIFYLGGVCFFRGKMSAVCGPHLQTSAAEEVDQTSAVCKKKTVCFLTPVEIN